MVATPQQSMVLICVRVNANARPKVSVDKLVTKVMSQCGTSTMVHLNRHLSIVLICVTRG